MIICLSLHTNAHESGTNFSKIFISRISELKNLDNEFSNSKIRDSINGVEPCDMKAIDAKLYGNYMLYLNTNA